MRISSLTNEIVQPARYVKQTCSLDSVAIFKLRLTPVAGLQSIRFTSEALEPEVEPRIAAAIQRGVMKFVAEREDEGRPVGGLCVMPFDIYVHPVDGRDIGFTLAAYFAMRQAFQDHERLVEIGPEVKNET